MTPHYNTDPRQDSHVRSYCKEHGYAEVHVISDEGVLAEVIRYKAGYAELPTLDATRAVAALINDSSTYLARLAAGEFYK